MKKLLVSLAVVTALCATVVCAHRQSILSEDALLANVEALSESEYTVFGKCRREDGSCMTACPRCGAMLGSVPDQAGPAYDVHGICPNCEKKF